jgi:hypothetical protein
MKHIFMNLSEDEKKSNSKKPKETDPDDPMRDVGFYDY